MSLSVSVSVCVGISCVCVFWCVCACVRACVVLDPCVLVGEGKSAARRIAKLDPNACVAAMNVFTHVPTPTALNHDSRTKEERSKADEETNRERIDLFATQGRRPIPPSLPA